MPTLCRKIFLGVLQWNLRKFVACTVCAVTTALAAAGCADGTGQALTPTLPSVDASASNADGTKLKAAAPQPLSPQSAVRVTNLTPQLVLQNGAGTFDPSAALSYVFEVFEVDRIDADARRSSPIRFLRGAPRRRLTFPRTISEVEQDVCVARRMPMYTGVAGFALRRRVVQNAVAAVAVGRDRWRAAAMLVRRSSQCVGNAYPAYLVKTNAGDRSLERRQRQHGIHPRPHHRDRHLQRASISAATSSAARRSSATISSCWRSNIGKNGRTAASISPAGTTT